MSLIGKLEQLNLSNVLQRIEAFAKTGLLVIKQDIHWVELYFRDGRLLCIGPVRANFNLGERLLQAGIISQQALQEVMLGLGASEVSETRMAFALMKLNYVTDEDLYRWASKQATDVIRALLAWTNGDLYFEDEVSTPPERLLIALSISSILSSIAAAQVPVTVSQPQLTQTPAPTSSPSFLNVADLLAEPSQSFGNSSLFSQEANPAETDSMAGSDVFAQISTMPPVRATNIMPQPRIDVSFMRPEMVLYPVDLSTLRAQNPKLQLTPDQWRLLTRVDGHTSLRAACTELAMAPQQVCEVAGELMAQGLIQVSMPVQDSDELTSTPPELVASGLSNGYVVPGYAASPAQPWAVTPNTDGVRMFSQSPPIETQSQWGNGGNGATFVPGRGWVLSSQPLQPLQPSGQLAVSRGAYMPAGAGR